MKKLLLIALLFCINQTKAQFVTIPDANFAAYLDSIIPSAMNGNQMDTTNSAVTSYTAINVENDSIGDLTGVQYFDSLKTLDCGNGNSAPNPNYLTSLPKLPSTLGSLTCCNNKLTSLPALPSSLVYLNCPNNRLTSLPTLNDSLKLLDCSGNLLTSLPSLPNSLSALACGYNVINSLPTLPGSLQSLIAVSCQLANLPALPPKLQVLYVGVNQLTSIPVLPDSLQQFACQQNQLTSLPNLPNTLFYLSCNTNQISSLPALPNTLQAIDCSYNNITCFQHFPDSLVTPNNGNCIINNNPFTCLPNYVPAMDAATLTYPLCMPSNTNGCPGAQGIVGFTYKDMNADCIKNLGDSGLKNIPLKIYDNSNNLLGQTYSALNGVFDFPQTAGTYSIVVDTTTSAFMIQCAHPGLDSVVTVSSIDTNINFSFTCKPGFDVGVQSTVINGLIFPGQQYTLSVVAGDLSQWNNLNCAAGVSGQVQISVTGPLTYVGPAAGALTPSVAGNVYTYTIADFGTVNISTAFNLIFSTNTNAQAGDTVCINIGVTPTAGDNNPSNNNYSFCYQVVNSHDPNHKETYPVDVAPNYNNWFTYTIHFQNTGSASAINIRLADTLDAKLDLSTFQLINYSHKNTVMLNHNILSFNFHNINLPDSTSNKAASSGFVQYRIKPKANLPAGTQIKNTAYIYFDYNAAIVTNTSLNNFNASSGIPTYNTKNSTIKIYPNPANNKITIDATDVVDVKLFDVVGKQIFSTKENNVDVSNLTNGVYFIQVQTKQNTTTQKIMVQH